MKTLKLMVCFVMLVSLIGCTGLQIGDNTSSQAISYFAGKGMAIGIYKLKPSAAPSIEQEWMDMMGRNYDKTEIPAKEFMGFFNDVVLKQVPTLKNDKYGFAGDLLYLLNLYGATYTPEGNLLSLKPVPMEVAKAFQVGYESGRSVSLK